MCSYGTPTDQFVGVWWCTCNVFQWDTHLSSFGGLGGVQCVPVGHPLVQFVELGWCAVCSSGTCTHLSSLWSWGGVQCIPVGHPFNQEVWDQLTLSCSQSACLAHLFACFCLTPSSSIKRGADQLYSPVGNETRSLCVCLWSQNGVMQHDTKLYKATAVPR